MAAKLDSHYQVLYRGREGLSAHEFIVDLRPFKASAGIVEEDVAKRLQVSVLSCLSSPFVRLLPFVLFLSLFSLVAFLFPIFLLIMT